MRKIIDWNENWQFTTEEDIERAERGELVSIKEIAAAHQAAVDHHVSDTQIYYVFHRHGWRKMMPRSRHPKKASDKEFEIAKITLFVWLTVL